MLFRNEFDKFNIRSEYVRFYLTYDIKICFEIVFLA